MGKITREGECSVNLGRILFADNIDTSLSVSGKIKGSLSTLWGAGK